MATTGSKVSFDIGDQMDLNTSHSSDNNQDFDHMDKSITDHKQLIILTNAATSHAPTNQTDVQIKQVSSHPQQIENTLVI